VVKAL